MKIQYVSDLHLEFGYGNALELPITGDILVLGGDINLGKKTAKFANKFADRYKLVLLIAGNHEFYHSDYFNTMADFRLYDYADNVYFLENDSVVFLENNTLDLDTNGIAFFGGTMWTDLSNSVHAMDAKSFMNDFSIIRNTQGNPLAGYDTKFTTQDANLIHFEFETELKMFLEKYKDMTKVVISHHLPHTNSITTRFMGNSLNPAFMSPILQRKLPSEPDIWIHGHTHDTCDYMSGNTRVLCNPRGYHPEMLNPDFNKGAYVEI